MHSLHRPARFHWLRWSGGVLATLLVGVAIAQEKPSPASRPGVKVPQGAEKAVAASLAAFPGAVLDQVVTPSEAFGLGGEHDAYWTVRIRVDDIVQTLRVGADGVLIRGSKPVQTKDLPSSVASGMARMAPKGAATITKLESFAVLRYVALPRPQVRYVARVTGDAGATEITVGSEGRIGTMLGRKEATTPKKTPKRDESARTTDGPVPEQAAGAVRAMREVFPDMVFDLVEEVPYLDRSTQTMVMLWYEVEFFVDGVKHEFNATPDGIVIEYRKEIRAADLPEAAAATLAHASANGTIEQITLLETRAEPRIVPLDPPVVVYEIEPNGEAGENPTSFKLRIDGTEVKEPELPDWAK